MNDNPGAFAELAFHFDGSVVLFNYLLHIAETEAESLDIMSIACGYTVKLLKNMFQVLPGDSYAVVRHCDDNSFVVTCSCHGDLRYAGGIFQRVIKEIEESH